MVLSLILSLLLLGCDNAENEAFILPKNYTGYILIIFNQSNGSLPKYDGKKRVYEVPVSGILRTSFTKNDGWTDFPQFYYEKIRQSNQIAFKTELEKLPTDTTVAFGGTSGSVKKSEKSEERIEFVEFYVGTKSQIELAKEDLAKLDIVKLAE